MSLRDNWVSTNSKWNELTTPDKSDVIYKEHLKEQLLEHGHEGNNFVEVRITSNDVEAITEDGTLWYFEAKGTASTKPLIQTYGNEILLGLENAERFRIALIRLYKEKFQPILFYDIHTWIKQFPAQLPALKGTLYIGNLTQEMIDNNVSGKNQKRRETTLMGTPELFLESKQLHERFLEKQDDSHRIWNFVEKKT